MATTTKAQVTQRWTQTGDPLYGAVLAEFARLEHVINQLVALIDPTEVKRRPAVKNAVAVINKRSKG